MEVDLAKGSVRYDFKVPGEIMEEKRVFKIGDRVDQMCISCNEVRGHIVVSVSKAGKITRVGCPMCASRVMYRAGTTRRASNKLGEPYDRTRAYRKGQTLMHPTFGEGEVTAIIESAKMDVLFEDRIRRMIHAQSLLGNKPVAEGE